MLFELVPISKLLVRTHFEQSLNTYFKQYILIQFLRTATLKREAKDIIATNLRLPVHIFLTLNSVVAFDKVHSSI